MSCRHEYVAALDPIAEVVAKASNPATRKSLDKAQRPLVHQYPAWHDNEYKQTPPVCISGSSQSDIGFAGACDGLDDAAASATKPTDERFELPTVEKLFGAVHSAITSGDAAANPLVRLQTARGNPTETGVPERNHHTFFGAILSVLSSHSECNCASVLISAERPDRYRLQVMSMGSGALPYQRPAANSVPL